MINEVLISKDAIKDINKIPKHILKVLKLWIFEINTFGWDDVKKDIAWKNEAFKGTRFGQRSIRLNKSYRAIYKVSKKKIEFVLIEEVNKHDY